MSVQLPIYMSADSLDQMMPMHVLVAADGRIVHTGATLAKIQPGQALVGRPFFDIFELRRGPRTPNGREHCALLAGKLHLRLRDANHTQLIGTGARLASGDGVLLNLSFGISVVDAVARFNLAGSDFAATDLTVEMLYLVEAKSAAMAESRKLNERLNGARAAAEAEAQSDTLTGLANRRALDQVLARLLSRQLPFTLMHLDLDFFKTVNDTLGHGAGDLVLQHVAEVLRGVTRGDDVVARVGGDEFVLVFHKMTDERRLANIATRLIKRLEVPVDCPEGRARISASIGMVSTTIYDAPEADRMMRDADIALYASKARGRACHTVFTARLGAETPPEVAEEAHARAEH